LEAATSHSEPNQGKGVCVPVHDSIFGPETVRQRVPCELMHCHGGESNHWAKVQAFCYAQHHI